MPGVHVRDQDELEEGDGDGGHREDRADQGGAVRERETAAEVGRELGVHVPARGHGVLREPDGGVRAVEAGVGEGEEPVHDLHGGGHFAAGEHHHAGLRPLGRVLQCPVRTALRRRAGLHACTPIHQLPPRATRATSSSTRLPPRPTTSSPPTATCPGWSPTASTTQPSRRPSRPTSSGGPATTTRAPPPPARAPPSSPSDPFKLNNNHIP